MVLKGVDDRRAARSLRTVLGARVWISGNDGNELESWTDHRSIGDVLG
jgi:hypothetical protein